MRLAALLLQRFHGGVPEKITHATPHPEKRSRWLTSPARRYFHFGTETSAQCADIRWNLICQNPRESRCRRAPTTGTGSGTSLAHTPMHPQGPMNLSVLTKHVHGAHRRRRAHEWSEWPRTHRPLGPRPDLVVASLIADNGRFCSRTVIITPGGARSQRRARAPLPRGRQPRTARGCLLTPRVLGGTAHLARRPRGRM